MVRDLEHAAAPPCMVRVEECDARRMRLDGSSVDCIITSPPYLNNIDFTKVYAIENFFLGRPAPPIRSCIGLEEKDAGFLSDLDIPADARAYFKDMNDVLQEMHRVCRTGAHAAVVVGNAYYPQLERHVESDLILAELAEAAGFTVQEIAVLNKRFALERRTIQKGVIRESLIVMEK
jgi:DNA modification methylase